MLIKAPDRLLYNGCDSQSANHSSPAAFPFVFPIFPPFYTNTASHPHPHDPPPPHSRPVAQCARLTWYFTGRAPYPGSGSPFGGHRQPPSVWRGVAVGPLLGQRRRAGGLFRSQSLSRLRGHPLSPRWPISDSAGGGGEGLQTHPHRQANLSPLECEFSDLRLQMAHLQERQGSNNNLSEEYISASRFYL